MKQLSRLVFAAVLVLTLAVIGVGGTSVAMTYNNEIDETASVLNSGIQKVATAGGTLSSALVVADGASIPIAVGLVAFDHSVSVLRETDVVFSGGYTDAFLQSATKRAVIVDAEIPFQLRSYHTGDDEYILIATSIAEARHHLTSNVLYLVIASILAISLSGVLVYLIGRRNMRQVITQLTNSAEHERETRQSMQTFMGDASHELRTPLTVIKGYAELLAKGDSGDAEARERAFGRIVEQVDRMDETISSLLELAEVGSISVNSFEPVDLTALVTGAAEDLEAISPTREISVDVQPVTVSGSKSLLAKLLTNATGNIARHAGQKAAVNISLKAGKKQAVLVIEDGGKGLPDEAYARGVQAFRRFDESRSRETGGTGLGMSIMNSIVEAHSGVMQISKSKLGGLKLEITLPLN